MKEKIEKLVSKHTLNLGKCKTLEDYAETENNFTNELLKAINYTRCCETLKGKIPMSFSYWLSVNGYTHYRDDIFIDKDELTYFEDRLMQMYNEEVMSL